MAIGRAEDTLAVISAIAGLDPANYQRSALHADDRMWPEKNCYVDIWIEVLHALQLETRAMLPFVLAADFEGDQWTFFKPAHEDLFDLYGVEVQELNVWKPLLEHAVTHLSAGKLISTEADAFWLPDVAGTDYRRNHVKTTIVLNSLDVEDQTLDYFHNSAYHRLGGEDFTQLFRVGAAPDNTFMPLFAEFIRIDRVHRSEPKQLAAKSVHLLRRYVKRRPAHNPVTRLGRHFEEYLPALQGRGLDYYHLWAFGSVRQLGASCELAAENLQWLHELGALHAPEVTESFRLISSTCKTLIMKGARAVTTKRPTDLRPLFDTMTDAWDIGMRSLEKILASA
jgi:hypothetical protein